MKLLRISALTLISMAVIGCSSLGDRAKPEGGFNYLTETETEHLKVPTDFEAPARFKDFEIVSANTSNAIGEQVDVRAPRLVLPLLAGTHVEEGSKKAKLMFDQVDDSKPLAQSIWEAVEGFLSKQNIATELKDDHTLSTAWVETSSLRLVEAESDDGWFSSSNDEAEIDSGLQKFEFVLDVRTHGRTAALTVNMLAQQNNVDGVSKRNLEASMLNAVVAHYDYQQRLTLEKLRRQIREGLTMRLGFDNNGNPAYVVDADFERTWSRLPLVFRKLGFDIKDLDKSDGVYYIEYNEPDSGWFSFGSEGELVKLGFKEEKYRIQLADLGNTTSIGILDDENTPIANDVLTGIFTIFADYMGSDSLDI